MLVLHDRRVDLLLWVDFLDLRRLPIDVISLLGTFGKVVDRFLFHLGFLNCRRLVLESGVFLGDDRVRASLVAHADLWLLTLYHSKLVTLQGQR